MQLLEPFTPDDAFMFGSRPIVEPEPNKSISKESLSFDEVNYPLRTQIVFFFGTLKITKIVYACVSFITGHTCRFIG